MMTKVLYILMAHRAGNSQILSASLECGGQDSTARHTDSSFAIYFSAVMLGRKQ
jgi:hypothetical protein